MSRLQRAEAEITALTLMVVDGLTQAADDFPSPPVPGPTCRPSAEVGLPFDTISYVRFKRGVFSAEIAIQGRDMKTMDGLPTVKQARVRLRFKRDLRGDAEWFAMALERLGVPVEM